MTRQKLSTVALVLVTVLLFGTSALAKEVESVLTDVVVVGGGGAGLSAAATAASRGAEVVLLEKLPFLGGSSILSGGAIAFAGTDIQEAAGIEDSSDRLYYEIMKVGLYKSDRSLVRAYVDNQLATYEWLKQIGVEFSGVGLGGGMEIPRAHNVNLVSLIQTLKQVAEKNGAKIVMETRGERLITDPATGRVIGVVAKQGDKEIRYYARKGVILATGGFAFNKELLAKFCPIMANAAVMAGRGSEGDGLKMAWKVGADIQDTAYIKATFGFYPEGKTIDDLALTFYHGAIIVSKDGERFVDESINYKALGDAALAQKDGIGIQIFDEKIKQSMAQEALSPVFELEKKGYVVKADTLAELAVKLGIPADKLEQTVAEYNANVEEKGYDPKFGRTGLASGSGALVKIENPPFYGMPSTGVILGTYGGVLIDDHARVLDVFGEPIPGLYAAGEVTGGMHGEGYMTGNALGKAIVFGRIAGNTIVEE